MKRDMKLDEFIEEVGKKAKQEGFSEYELFYVEGESFGAGAYEGNIDTYEVNATRGISFRGIIDGKLGTAYSEALDENAVTELVISAKGNAALTDCTNEEEFYDGKGKYPEVNGYFSEIDKVGEEEKIKMALSLEEKVLKKDSRIKGVEHCMISTGSSEVRIVNSKGLNKSFRSNLAAAVLVPVAEENGRMYSGLSERVVSDFSKIDLDEMASEAADDALSYVGAVPLKTGQTPIVFKPGVMSELLACFSGIFNAENAQKGYSKLYHKEGEKIAADCVTLIDDPLYPGGLANAPFDAEGVPVYTKNVLEKGVLKTLLYNLKTAKKDGVKTTGNASRASYKSSVSISPYQFYLMPSETPKKELFKAADGGVYVTEISGLHAGANLITGDFSLSAKGFKIEKGEQGTPLEQFILTGNFYDLLKSITMVGDDLKFEAPSGSGCFGSPTVFVPKMTVAGS